MKKFPKTILLTLALCLLPWTVRAETVRVVDTMINVDTVITADTTLTVTELTPDQWRIRQLERRLDSLICALRRQSWWNVGVDTLTILSSPIQKRRIDSGGWGVDSIIVKDKP